MVSSNPKELRTSFKAEYDATATGTKLVDLVNSSQPQMSAIIDDALAAGFILADAGPALHVGGQVHDIQDSQIETQRLLAKKAALEEDLQQLQMAEAQARYQTAQWERQSADATRRTDATRKRVRAIGYTCCSALPD